MLCIKNDTDKEAAKISLKNQLDDYEMYSFKTFNQNSL